MLATESTATDAWSRNHGDTYISPAVRTETLIAFFSNESTHTQMHTRAQVKLARSQIRSSSMSCIPSYLSVHRRLTFMETVFFTNHFTSLVPITTGGLFIR